MLGGVASSCGGGLPQYRLVQRGEGGRSEKEEEEEGEDESWGGREEGENEELPFASLTWLHRNKA